MTYSVIIKNGIIFDGTGKESFKSDIGISKEKIVEIRDLQKGKADLIIDATDFYVSPGFIDLTTHSDNHWTLLSQPGQENFIKQGVTTILGGHGGSSLAPVLSAESIGAIEKWANVSEININWTTMDEFFEETERHNLAVNFGTLVGHETLRRNVLNNLAKEATTEEIKKITALLEQSLEDGAFGLSTNFGTSHSQAASRKEILKIFEVLKKYNVTSMHHLEDEGKNLLPAVSRLIMLLRTWNNKGHISHFKALGRGAWEDFENGLNMIELAREEGILLTCDFFPYTSTGSNLSSLLPSWALAESRENILNFLKNEESRKNLTDYLKSLTLHYDKIMIASTARDTSSLGKTVKTLSDDSGLSPEDVIIDLLYINDLRVSIFNDIILQKNIDLLSGRDYAMVASDGVGYEINKINTKRDLPHPRSFGTFAKVFSDMVKNRNILTWEEAIRKMTGLPAETLGINNRGIIQKNNYADIVIFDPKTIEDRATYQVPIMSPSGIKHVFVNGVLAFSENSLKETRAGKILRHGR